MHGGVERGEAGVEHVVEEGALARALGADDAEDVVVFAGLFEFEGGEVLLGFFAG